MILSVFYVIVNIFIASITLTCFKKGWDYFNDFFDTGDIVDIVAGFTFGAIALFSLTILFCNLVQ